MTYKDTLISAGKAIGRVAVGATAVGAALGVAAGAVGATGLGLEKVAQDTMELYLTNPFSAENISFMAQEGGKLGAAAGAVLGPILGKGLESNLN